MQLVSIDVDRSESIINYLRSTYDNSYYALTDTGGCGQEIKWPFHEEELRALSDLAEYGVFIFVLQGEEENGDRWIKYFHRGRMQIGKVEVLFESFDKNKLQ